MSQYHQDLVLLRGPRLFDLMGQARRHTAGAGREIGKRLAPAGGIDGHRRQEVVQLPDFLTLESEGIKAEWEAGNVALMFLWASRASTLLDDEGSTAQIVSSTKLVGPPTVAGGSIPISTLWWDGFTIATNIPDEDAEATFRALVRPSSSSEMANKNSDQAVWLVKGFEPGQRSIGVISAAKAGAKPYPMLPYMGLLHNAAGAELVEFLQGRETAEQALADIEAAYVAVAKEAGFLR